MVLEPARCSKAHFTVTGAAHGSPHARVFWKPVYQRRRNPPVRYETLPRAQRFRAFFNACNRLASSPSHVIHDACLQRSRSLPLSAHADPESRSHRLGVHDRPLQC
jgi:hypothetical protein